MDFLIPIGYSLCHNEFLISPHRIKGHLKFNLEGYIETSGLRRNDPWAWIRSSPSGKIRDIREVIDS